MNDTLKRVLAVLPLIPAILWMMFAGPAWTFLALVLGATLIIGFELARMIAPGEALLQSIVIVGTIAVASTRLYTDDPQIMQGVMIGVAILTLVGALIRPDPVEKAALRIGWMFGAPIYGGMLLSSIALIHRYEDGGSWVLLAMLVAWLSDTLAYFSGKFFGKRKLYPKLSPKKTVEGALGGLMGSVLGALGVSLLLMDALPVHHAVALGLICGVLGQSGDLFESLIKRSVGVKDSGNLLPGHGGILDRVDALMYASSGIWLYAHFILGLRPAG